MAVVLDTPQAIRRSAMDLLAMREHGRVELQRKLLRKGAKTELIEPVLDQLALDGLLNEARYLEAFIASRARAGYGPLRIREELAQRGLPRGQIDEAIQDSGFDWDKQLAELWQKRFAELPTDLKARAKQARFLLYRGFAQGAVSRLLKA